MREMLRASYYAIDRKQLKDMDLTVAERFLLKKVLKKIKNTDVETLLKDSNLI